VVVVVVVVVVLLVVVVVVVVVVLFVSPAIDVQSAQTNERMLMDPIFMLLNEVRSCA